MIAATVRAAGGLGRRGRRMTRVLSFIMLISGLDDRAGPPASASGPDCTLPGGVVPFAEAMPGPGEAPRAVAPA
jgi:hypothetical protein